MDISTGSRVIKCPKCAMLWEFRPEITTRSFITFDHPKKPFTYEITSDIVIGRDSTNDFVMISCPNSSLKPRYTNIRSYAVSHEHAAINIKKVYEPYDKNDSSNIITKLKCSLKNIGKFGIQKNDEIIPPDKFVELNDQDVFVLAPNKDKKVKITFEEKLIQYD
jgi:hypothetical protein